MALARTTKNGLKPNTTYEVRIIVERQSENGKIFYLFVDQNKHLVYATDILRKLINKYDWSENIIRYEDVIVNDFINVFNSLFRRTPFARFRTDNKCNFYCID